MGKVDQSGFRARLLLMAAIFYAAMTAPFAMAADYPSGPIRIIIALPPGGSADTIGRYFAEHLNQRFKQTVIVENRPGADALIGPTYVARSKPDGLTLLFTTPSLPTFRALFKNPAIDPEKDLVAIGQVVESPYFIAVPANSPVKTLPELLAQVRANPGKFNVASFAAGNRLTVESFKRGFGLDMVTVAYKGEAAMSAALQAGEVNLGIATAVTIVAPAKEGKLRVLAVTGKKRATTLPEAPTVAESGVTGFEPGLVWFGLLAPVATPKDIVKTLSDEIFAFTSRPELPAKLEPFGFVPAPTSTADFTALVAREARNAIESAKAAGIEPQ
ncbi:MAG TPA: tripartite tricarboxylate transporter substrate binding protein [Beijerinckiaceae bacterium]|jgi:tripartite-type tricarboxylate transporter receptor subunit TctC|nr:tripartite tricarboxylate transporter substrate binding protein [Beijerinckiaceae bacterium]